MPLTEIDQNVRAYPDYKRGSILDKEKPSLTVESYASKTRTSAKDIVSGVRLLEIESQKQ